VSTGTIVIDGGKLAEMPVWQCQQKSPRNAADLVAFFLGDVFGH
jgi:hypothetical protein